MKATMSILGLYNYNNSIFDNLKLPEGVNKEDVTNNLLMELAEFELIYSNFDMMQAAIGFWSKKELPVWTKLYATTIQDYNPIWNQFRSEEFTDVQTRNLSGSDNETRNLSGSDNETRNLSGSDNETRNLSGSDNETRNLSGSDNETRNLSCSDNETRNLTGGENETRNLTGTSNRKSNTTGETKNNGTDTQKEYVSAFNETTATLAKQNEQILGAGNTVAGEVVNEDTSTDKGTVNKTNSDSGTVNKSISDSGTIEKSITDSGTVNKSITDIGTVNKAITDIGTVNKSITDNGTVNKAITDTGTVENVHTAKYEGHTGIIPVQKLLEMERETVKFNVIDYIINSFKTRFCILIY